MKSKDIQTLLHLANGRITEATAAAIASDLDAEGLGDLLGGLHETTDPESTYFVLEKFFAKQRISLFDLLDSGPSPNFDEALENVNACLSQYGTIGLDGEIWIVSDDYGTKEICVEMSSAVYAEQSRWTATIQSALAASDSGYKVIVSNRDRTEEKVQIEREKTNRKTASDTN